MSNLVVSNISDGTDTVGTSYVLNGSAKAWVNSVNTAVIQNSFNVSSGTDHGTGDYSFALTNSFSYSTYAQAGQIVSAGVRIATQNSGRYSASTLAVYVATDGGSAADSGPSIVAHGDLA